MSHDDSGKDDAGMLEAVDLDAALDKQEYRERLARLQVRLITAQRGIEAAKIPVVIVYEGMDASGKGGSVRRLTRRLDPRVIAVHEIGPPTPEELAHHYLWRFWQRLPARGHIAVFDRSWYGRVLVERVDELTPRTTWERAYREIDEFERWLVDDGTVLVKLLLHISKHEQLARFQAREQDPLKSWKLLPEDWHNREKWDRYVEAMEQMLRETSTAYAPWTIVPADDKRYARVRTLEVIVEEIEHALARQADVEGTVHHRGTEL